MNPLAHRVDYINEPQTIAMAKLARELMAQGKDVISLSLGEPDFETPIHIKEAAKKAIDAGYSYYTPVAGIPELRQAISEKFKRDNNLLYQLDEIIVSTGAKHSIMNAVMALVNPGDEVLIPTPYWVSYSEMAKLMEGVPVFIKSSVEQNYKINAAQLEAAITPKSKLFIFSSPCNPTGSVYSEAELAELVKVFEKYPNIYIISDEIYEHINFVGKHVSMASFESIKNRVITVNGLSKGFSMTGWRLGYIGASKTIVQACEKIQSQYTSGTSHITQRAAIAALSGDMKPTHDMVSAFKKRRELVVNGLNEISGLKNTLPEGAFYAFPEVSFYYGKSYQGKKINDSTDLCMYLLHEACVSLVPGDGFGAPECLRMSYATGEEKLTEALKRIKEGLSKLA
jgi:aspartate aminotransferase